MDERVLKLEWIEAAVRAPEWTESDPDPLLERRFRSVPERGGRVLRVVCYETDQAIGIVTAFLDRRARRRKWR